MHRKETLFLRSREKPLFGPLHEGATSDLEYYLRFEFAVQNFMAHVNREYAKSKMYFETFCKIPEKTRYDFFFPKRGKPVMLTTQIVTEVCPISFQEQFKRDPLFERFKIGLTDPIKSFEFMLESEYLLDDENDKLVSIFRNAYNDSSWKAQLPRLLLDKKRK